MAQSAARSPDGSMSPSLGQDGAPISMNTIRLALIAMKERCQLQKTQIQELEHDNAAILASRNTLEQENQRLQEANAKLTQTNLALNDKLHLQLQENVEVRTQLNSLQHEHGASLRQLEQLQDEVSRQAPPADTSRNQSQDVEVKSLEAAKNMDELKAKVLEQRRSLQTVLQLMTESIKASQGRPVTEAVADEEELDAKRKCPMCEATFEEQVKQEDFEAHVVEHFSYEEGETIRNFDFVNDANDLARFV